MGKLVEEVSRNNRWFNRRTGFLADIFHGHFERECRITIFPKVGFKLVLKDSTAPFLNRAFHMLDSATHPDFLNSLMLTLPFADMCLFVLPLTQYDAEIVLRQLYACMAFGVKHIGVCVLDFSECATKRLKYKKFKQIKAHFLEICRQVRFPHCEKIPFSAANVGMHVGKDSAIGFSPSHRFPGFPKDAAHPTVIELLLNLHKSTLNETFLSKRVKLAKKPFCAMSYMLYKIGGIGTVLAAKVISGELKCGDSIDTYKPTDTKAAALRTNVRSMERCHVAIEAASPGMHVGINFRYQLGNISRSQAIIITKPNESTCVPAKNFLVLLHFIGGTTNNENVKTLRRGFSCVMFCASQRATVKIVGIFSVRKTKRTKKKFVKQNGAAGVVKVGETALVMVKVVNRFIVSEPYRDNPTLGSVAFAEKRRLIAFGKVQKVYDVVEELAMGKKIPTNSMTIHGDTWLHVLIKMPSCTPKYLARQLDTQEQVLGVGETEMVLALWNDDGDSPMHIAARCGRRDLVGVMIKRKRIAFVKDRHGRYVFEVFPRQRTENVKLRHTRQRHRIFNPKSLAQSAYLKIIEYKDCYLNLWETISIDDFLNLGISLF